MAASGARMLGVAGAAGAALVLAACTSPGKPAAQGTPCARHGAAFAAPCASAAPSPTAVPHFSHIVVAVFGNESYSQVIGNPSAPYFSSLAVEGANFTQSFAEAHPGQPDYLALFSGGTHGVSSDSCPQAFTGPNLGGDLVAAGKSFTGYAEGLPAAGSTACSGTGYVRAHAPWTDFASVPASASQPFTAFPPASAFGTLPTVSFVIPDTCHAMTNCSPGTGDSWLESRLGAYAQWAVDNNSLLIVTFGQDGGTAGNRIPTIFYGAHVRPGNYGEHIDHYNVLRTIETACGLPFDGAAATAAPIADVWSGSPAPPAAAPSAGSTALPAVLPLFQHIVVVIFENHSYGQVIGSASAPYITQLAAEGANFTQFAAIGHPSQPNYLAMFSGSTHGVTSDACPQAFSTTNLAQGLIAAGKTFGGYVDALPASGASVCTSGNYARKHVPWADFSNVPASVTKPFTRFPQTAAGNFAGLPTVSYVVPDLCNDMHNCSVATGDTWLSSHLSAYGSWAVSNNSLLIVTFDENNGAAGNIIPTVFVGAHVKPGTYSEHVNHYSLLRMLEDAYGMPYDGAAASATPMPGVWLSGS